MHMNFLMRTAYHPPEANESAVGVIHRPLHGHPEPCHAERSEASLCPLRQMLRCAQHDRAVTPTDAWSNV
jgi:hypothetical protein